LAAHAAHALSGAGAAGSASGGAHTSGAHAVPPAATSVEPAAHETTPTRHDACVASGKDPAGHSVQSAEPAGAYAVAAHLVHVDGDVAPTAADAVPSGHAAHVDMPSAGA